VKTITKSFITMAAVASLLAGCESGAGTTTAPNAAGAKPAPAGNSGAASSAGSASSDNEFTIYTVYPGYYADEAVYQKQIGQYLAKQFPDVKFKHIFWDNPGRQYKDLLAAGTVPDLIFENAHDLQFLKNIVGNDLQYDLSPLIKKYNFDTSKLNQAAMAVFQTKTQDGKIYGLPFQIDDLVMFYNKDIFDKFGVSYPKNGMTYDQVYDLAKRLTRQDGDVTYKGYAQQRGWYMTYNQLSLSPFSQTKDEAELVTPDWIRLVDNLKRFYQIPGNAFTSENDFVKGHMAMDVTLSQSIVKWYEQNKNLHFGIVSMPSFPDKPNVKSSPNEYAMYITKQSKNKDLAFKVMQFLLSEPMAINFAKEGIVTPLQTQAVQAAFGKNLPQMQGVDTSAIFYGQNAMPPAARQDGLTWVYPPLDQVFKLIESDNKDTPTALRVVQESVNKTIQTAKAAKAATAGK
jgi:multiple sugar transport system substrate-binding protein